MKSEKERLVESVHVMLWTLGWIVLIGGGLVMVVLVANAWRDGRNEDLHGLEVVVGLTALLVTAAAALVALPELLEWGAEHRRTPRFRLLIECSESKDVPGVVLPEVCRAVDLPAEPMWSSRGATRFYARAIVSVEDRFPLTNCVVNIVVPADWTITPVQASERFFAYPVVTPQALVAPEGDHGCRFTVTTGDLNGKTDYGFAVEIEGRQNSVDPLRVMVELSCTPVPDSDAERFRFALLGVNS